MTTDPARRRRRGEVLEQAILDAAWAEIQDTGWAGFTIDAVAKRAGTAKAVIYRRWDDRVALAQEMLRRSSRTTTWASTGSLRADLIGFLSDMSAFLAGPFGHVARGTVCDSDAPGQASLLTETAEVAGVAAAVRAALNRGELAAPPSPVAVNAGHALVMAEFLLTGQAPGPKDVERLVDVVWLPALSHTADGHARPPAV